MKKQKITVTFGLLLVSLLGCNTTTLVHKNKQTQSAATAITLYLDSTVVQSEERDNDTLDEEKNRLTAQRIEERVRLRLKAKGYQLNRIILTSGSPLDDDNLAPTLPHILSPTTALDTKEKSSLRQLYLAADRLQPLTPSLPLADAKSEAILVLIIRGRLKSDLEKQHDNAAIDMRRMFSAKRMDDDLDDYVGTGRYRLVLYNRKQRAIIWSAWGEEPLRQAEDLPSLVEPALGTLPVVR